MEAIKNILSLFDSISLEQMDAVKLMDRTDKKFVFSKSLLPQILQALQKDYRVLEIGSNRMSYYRSLYYDDAQLRFYFQHHNGWRNRVKIRHRTYVESKLAYLEVKQKTNKGRTIKSRIEQANFPEQFDVDLEQFIKSKVEVDAKQLQAVIWVNYERITLVNKHHPERLTIDLNLEFEEEKKSLSFSNLVIVEVKQDKRNHSPFFSLAKNLKIKEGSISKYCMGISLLRPEIKQNNFKRKLRQLMPLINN
ncbi:MAG: polyphosphate polymerase domain-containing protein [Bacteroidia bacterium]|nr:polyphosphate polymerase domain-containing protein [Bacteroidia bacterium]